MPTPTVHRMAIVARCRIVVPRMAVIASVLTLLQRMIKRPTAADGMTGIARADVATRSMAGRPLYRVARCATTRSNTRMIIKSGGPCRGIVATVTSQRCFGAHMRRGFTDSRGAATARHTNVTVPGRCPCVCVVALVAHHRRFQPGMTRRPARRGYAVMAIQAGAVSHSGVVIESGIPGGKAMAGIASRG
jgi:hypothetical protein